ncbi:four helix bundle protein [Patescibacteria group bacterium]|nr:four helix bundle protein [Patescibacteria group bacterium]
MTINKLEDLEAWQEARKLCKGIYIITRDYPRSEEYNLKKHMRESSRGTAANIGEGFGRYYFKENLRFYGIAKGCLDEVRSDLYISSDVGYINSKILEKFIKQVNTVEAKINGLINNSLTQMKKYSTSMKSKRNNN